MITLASITIIVPAAHVVAAREFGAALAASGAGMYTTALSPTGTEPATHYVSSGLIDSQMVPLLSSGAMLYGAAQAGAKAQGLTLTATRTDADALVAESDVSKGDAFAAFERLGLQMVSDKV